MSNQSKVLREFTTHPGEILYREDIASTTGLTHQQVSNAVWALIHNKSQPIREVAAGSWKYDPQSTQGKRIFEEVATLKDGTIIIQDEDGTPLFAYPEPRR